MILFPLFKLLVWHFPFWIQFSFEASHSISSGEKSEGKLQYETLVYMFGFLQRGYQSFSISKLLLPKGLLPGENLRELGSLFIRQIWEKLLSWLFEPSLWNFSGDFLWLILPGYLPNSPTDAKVQGIKLKDIKALIERVTFLKRKTNLKIFSGSVNS